MKFRRYYCCTCIIFWAKGIKKLARSSRKWMRNEICEIFLEKLATSILLRHVRGRWEFARSFDDYVVAMINEWLSVRVYLINRPTCTEVKNLPVIIRGYSNQVANAESLRWLMSRSCYYSPRWWRCTFTCASWTSAMVHFHIIRLH